MTVTADPITFRSQAESPLVRDLTESVYAVLWNAVPNKAEDVLLEDILNTRKGLDALKKYAEENADGAELVQRAETMLRHSTRSLVMVALSRFNYRHTAIAPVDYPALADALAHV